MTCPFEMVPVWGHPFIVVGCITKYQVIIKENTWWDAMYIHEKKYTLPL